MLPEVPGLTKQAVLIKKGVPVASNVPGRVFGSQTRSGRAFISPPVKSVIVVEAHVFVEPGCKTNPAAQASPALMDYVPPLKDHCKLPVPVHKVLGFPLAYEAVPEICQLSKSALTKPLFQRRLSFGMS